MKSERRFLIAPSFARLIQRERGITARVVKGFFPPQETRIQFVRLEGDHAQLVLVTSNDGEWETEAVDVPFSHAAALVDVAPGHLVYDRSVVPVADERTGFLDLLFELGPIDLLTVDFDARADAETFEPPVWFGREVTDDPQYTKAAIALGMAPHAEEEVSNGALEALLDAFEDRYGAPIAAKAEVRPPRAATASQAAAHPPVSPAVP